MKPGDEVRLDAGDYGQPIGVISALLERDRAEVKLLGGGVLIAPLAMLSPATRRRATRSSPD